MIILMKYYGIYLYYLKNQQKIILFKTFGRIPKLFYDKKSFKIFKNLNSIHTFSLFK